MKSSDPSDKLEALVTGDKGNGFPIWFSAATT